MKDAMKKVGDKITLRYKGKVTDQLEVKKIAKLPEPEQYEDSVMGKISFNPTIILLEQAKEPHRVIWFPYWTSVGGRKERYGQFAPMFAEDTLLCLLKEAIRQGIFTEDFLKGLLSTVKQP